MHLCSSARDYKSLSRSLSSALIGSIPTHSSFLPSSLPSSMICKSAFKTSNGSTLRSKHRGRGGANFCGHAADKSHRSFLGITYTPGNSLIMRIVSVPMKNVMQVEIQSTTALTMEPHRTSSAQVKRSRAAGGRNDALAHPGACIMHLPHRPLILGIDLPAACKICNRQSIKTTACTRTPQAARRRPDIDPTGLKMWGDTR